MFHSDLDEWDVCGGKEVQRERVYVCIWMIHVVVQQRLTQNCKAPIPQLKKKKRGLHRKRRRAMSIVHLDTHF